MSLSTPRILPEHLHNFVESNRLTPNTIRVLGMVASLRGDYATITCGNHGDISVILNRDTHIQVGSMVDIVGKVVEVEGVRHDIHTCLDGAACSSDGYGISMLTLTHRI